MSSIKATRTLMNEFRRKSMEGPQILEQLETQIMRDAVDGKFSIENFDFEQCLQEFAQEDESVGDFLHYVATAREGSLNTRKGRGLLEHKMDGMDGSGFEKLLGTTVRVGMLETCDHAPKILCECFDTINVGCGLTYDTDLPKIPDIADESCVDEETQFYGLEPPNCVTIPERSKRKFAFAMKREMLCFDVNNALRGIMRQGAEALDLRKEKLLADMIIRGYPIGTDGQPIDPIRYLYNGKRYRPYQHIGSGGPFENYCEGTLDTLPHPTACNTEIFQHIEDLECNMVDPQTCEPCATETSPLQALTASKRAKGYMEGLLGPMSVEKLSLIHI